ncbi:hypothetical protein [Lyngbya aestuarii]|uniref:hypothetical protein n=1 Tax=Lyngbya aestuarii TaxID=118322 RepID=UPI00403D857C
MRKASALILGLLALILAIWGIKLLLSERNVFGNPQLETLMAQCQIPSTETETTIRLYEGNGGATVAYSYSVTFFEGKFFREKQFFYTYGFPVIKSIDCHNDRVSIFTDEETFDFTLEQIKSKLIHQPIGFYKGQQQKSSIQPLRVLTLTFGLFLELVSAWILRMSLKQFRASLTPGQDLRNPPN